MGCSSAPAGRGIGFLRVSWAVWLVIGESAFFIPIEILDMVRRHNPSPDHPHFLAHPRIGVLIILMANVAIVWYLFKNRDPDHQRHHESPTELMNLRLQSCAKFLNLKSFCQYALVAASACQAEGLAQRTALLFESCWFDVDSRPQPRADAGSGIVLYRKKHVFWKLQRML